MIDKKILSDALRCELCGEYFENITTHLIHIHDMDTKTYKQRFGLSHLMCDRLRQKLAESKVTLPRTRKIEFIPYGREEIIKILKRLHKVNPDFSPTDLNTQYPRLPGQIRFLFGKISTAFHEAGISAKQIGKWDEQRILKAIKSRKRRRKSLASKDVLDSDNRLWGAGGRTFGSWGEAIEAAGLNYESILKKPVKVEKQEIDRDLRAWAYKHGPLISADLRRSDKTFTAE